MINLPFILFILTGATFISHGAAIVSEEESQKIIKEELQAVAHNFRSRLKSEISNLEADMYAEFLSFVEDINLAQISFSEALRQNLSTSSTEVMRKFGKVMTYSVYKVQRLNNKLHEVLTSLGAWPYVMESHLLSEIQDKILMTLSNTNTADYVRNRRHTSDSLHPGSIQSLPKLQELGYTEIFESGELVDYFSDEHAPPPHTISTDFDLLDDQLEIGRAAESFPRDCLDLLLSGHTQDRVYTIYPAVAGVGVEAWCDQSSEGGGWTVVVARRDDLDRPQLNFTRPATYYAHGFGRPHTHYWMGLEQMAALTRGVNSSLRVNLTDQNLTPASATYHTFSVGGRESGYMLEVGHYDDNSTAADALTPHSGRTFSFPGDSEGVGCANVLGVGWWFLGPPDCYLTLPTGLHGYTGRGGVEWREEWDGADIGPLTSLLLMVRRNLV